MTLFRRSLLVALVASVAIHLTVVAMTLASKPELELEGSGQLQHAVLGSSPFNTVAAGSIDQIAKADTAEVEPVEAEEITETNAAVTPETLSPTESPSANAIQPISAVQTTTSITNPSLKHALPLPASTQNALALQPVLEKSLDTVKEVVPASQADARQVPLTPEAAAPNSTRPLEQSKPMDSTEATVIKPVDPLSSDVKRPQPEAPLHSENTVSKVEPVQSEPIEKATATTAKPVSPEHVLQEIASTIPPPPIKPKRSAENKKKKPAETKAKVKTAKQKTDAKELQSTHTSKSGAGGKSNSTAQKGGSQRKGKSKNAGNSDVTNYPAKVYRKLLRSVRSPRNAGRVQRDAIVRFTVNRNGSVSGVRLARSSGSKAFDQAVIKAVQRAAPFPPIPPAAGRNNWTFSLPVTRR